MTVSPLARRVGFARRGPVRSASKASSTTRNGGGSCSKTAPFFPFFSVFRSKWLPVSAARVLEVDANAMELMVQLRGMPGEVVEIWVRSMTWCT